MKVMNKQIVIVCGLVLTLVLFSYEVSSRAERFIITPAPSSAGLPVYDATGFPSAEAAISAIGSRKAVLIVSNEQSVQASLTVPANVYLRFAEGGLLIIKQGTTVTINGSLESGPHQIFRGMGLVNFAVGSIREVYPQWWGAKGDGKTDDTRAVQHSVNAIARAGGGDVVFRKGTYLVIAVMLDSNVNIIGQGWDSIIKQNKIGSQFLCSINLYKDGTPDPKDNKHDIKITNIQFLGTVDVDGFSEGTHLLNINAATNVVISKCKFVGWRGDAIYLGSGNVAKTERHNRNITISECVFDGLNNDNRNAISIIDGNAIVINRCSFVNCTRKNMPGAIDLEPDIENTFAIIRDITISNNYFKNIGGFGGVVSVVLLLGQTEFTTPSENIIISNNTIDQTGSVMGTDGIFLYQVQQVSDATPQNKITISGNIIRNTRRPFKLSGVKGVVFKNNTFERSTNAGLVASAMPISSKTTEKSQHLTFADNVFAEVGSVDGVGVAVLNDVDHLEFIGNTFSNVGSSNGTFGKAISFENGTADWIRIENNHFSGSRTKVAVSMESQAKTHVVHNKILNNTFANDQKILLPIVSTD